MIKFLGLPGTMVPGTLRISAALPWANDPMGRADCILVKTGAAHRFLVSESLTLPCPGVGVACLTGKQVING
jgi:hypothetical protein